MAITCCLPQELYSPSGPKVKLSNGKTVTNLGSYNFYNFNSNDQVKEKAIQVLRTYGVGPCGPPQFYGTQDVHMKTEADIASYIGTEACIVYAQAFSTISSVIPAFCKRGDIIVADRAVNFSIRRGLQISRSNIKWYDHGDMEDLERVMRRIAEDQSRKKLTRRFIVTEGLFETVGDCVDLPKLVSMLLLLK
jgi:7-keto-8-aminopelargonate synthetase-like enzyme